MNNRLQIAEELLGTKLVDGIYAPCPGRERHTKADGPKDFRVVLDGAPTGYCFHGSCSDDVAAFNKELRRRIWFAEQGERPAPRGSWGESVAAEPRAEVKARPPIDPYRVWEFTQGVPEIDAGWLARRSSRRVDKIDATGFLDAVFAPQEKVLIFCDQRTQGDFLWWQGRGGYRLAPARGVKAAASTLPRGGKEGVWYLVQPVTGQWAIAEEKARFREDENVPAKWTRRSQVNVTAWRHFVLESDELPEADWLKVLVNLPLPIAAIYTSGGRSIHALVRFEVGSKAEWDASRNVIRQIVCPLGADPAALSAVRLSRLPGCYRGERLQKSALSQPGA